MTEPGEILQIVPRTPGGREGVGDYAQNLATNLQQRYGYRTTFVAAQGTNGVLSPFFAISDEQWREHPSVAIILHYVNYGYHPRGVPRELPAKLGQIQQLTGASLITVFHELYASGSWRQSAFWLRPLQKRIARAIARRSIACIVSSTVLAGQLRRLDPAVRVIVRPVPSNFGEPVLSPEQLAGRDPRRWVICGGTELILRSLRSFLQKFSGAAELFVVGGNDSANVRQLLRRTRTVSTHYLPNVEVAVASKVLASSTFAWLDYFEDADVPTAAILKSTAFAACCAHGVIPVFPTANSPIALEDDPLPGPFTLESLPTAAEQPAVAGATYDWYQRHVASTHLAERIAEIIAS